MMDFTYLKTFTVGQLKRRQEEIQNQLTELEKERDALTQELGCKDLGCSIGERVVIGGRTYVIDEIYLGRWPQVRLLGGKRLRYCYDWKEWKAGKRETPF